MNVFENAKLRMKIKLRKLFPGNRSSYDISRVWKYCHDNGLRI